MRTPTNPGSVGGRGRARTARPGRGSPGQAVVVDDPTALLAPPVYPGIDATQRPLHLVEKSVHRVDGRQRCRIDLVGGGFIRPDLINLVGLTVLRAVGPGRAGLDGLVFRSQITLHARDRTRRCVRCS